MIKSTLLRISMFDEREAAKKSISGGFNVK